MSYKKGTIIFARRTIFADNGQYDLTHTSQPKNCI